MMASSSSLSSPPSSSSYKAQASALNPGLERITLKLSDKYGPDDEGKRKRSLNSKWTVPAQYAPIKYHVTSVSLRFVLDSAAALEHALKIGLKLILSSCYPVRLFEHWLRKTPSVGMFEDVLKISIISAIPTSKLFSDSVYLSFFSWCGVSCSSRPCSCSLSLQP